jgi:hypothetical protein
MTDFIVKENGIYVPKDINVFVKPTDFDISQRKYEGLQKLAEVKSWGLRNPTKFMKRFIGVDLLDVQNYVIMNSWTKTNAVWNMTRNGSKSTMIGLYYMTRGMLMNSCRCYICAGTGDQAIETFEKIVSIAKNEIESFTGLTDVFRNEVVKSQSNTDGFVRNPAGFTYRLYNGSFVKCVNSNINAQRGRRAECVCFDEGGWLPEETYQVIEPYTAQDKNFKLGGDIDVTVLPKELPNQILYASSASSVDSYYYKKYRDYAKKMFLGDPDYFVADINCEIMFNATYKGKLYPVPLITHEKVETALNENKEKGLREYYNIFTKEATDGAIIKRAIITRNSDVRPPILANDGKTKYESFVLTYDPARSADNSVVYIGGLYFDKTINKYKMDTLNLENFIDTSKKNKTPMTTPEQVKEIKRLLVAYNGKALDYENIEYLLIDGGSGGAGVNIADYLMADWYEEGHEGNSVYKHHGLLDFEESEEYRRKFPNALNKLKIMQPSKYKNEMYEALIEMAHQNLITFTAPYEHKGYLSMMDIDQSKLAVARQEIETKLKSLGLSDDQYAEQLEEELSEIGSAKTKVYYLTPEEEIALSQIDLLKEELVQMIRKKSLSSGGKDSFQLSPNVMTKMHDDRAYVMAMAGWALQQKNRDLMMRQNKSKDIKPSEMFKVSKRPKKWGVF